MVSVERICQYIRQDREDDGDLYKNCRHRLKHCRRPVGGHLPIKDRVSIEKRPTAANGTRYGGLGDGHHRGTAKQGCHAHAGGEKPGGLHHCKAAGREGADGLLKVAYRELLPYMGHIRSITTDNGTEFARHRELAKALGTKIYFTHPYASWEKGLIEYTNKLYRQYIPKGKGFECYTDEQIKQILYKINARPRKNSDLKRRYRLFSYLCRRSCILQLNLHCY